MIRYNGAAAQGKKVALGNATDLRIGYAGAYELWTIVCADPQISPASTRRRRSSSSSAATRASSARLAEGQLDMAVLSGFGVELDARGSPAASRVADPCVVMISASHPLAAKNGDPSARAQGHADRAQPRAGQSALGRADRRACTPSMGLRRAISACMPTIFTASPSSSTPASPSASCRRASPDWGIYGVVFRPVQRLSRRRRAHCWSIRAARQDTGHASRSCRSSGPSAE